MADIVLVHGAWGGSSGFRNVRPLLQQAGHNVFTPSLTGIGERSHLTGPHVDLNLHIKDVTNAIYYEDLDDFVLLGFSYGGMVVTGALDTIGHKVRHLVYLDAMVPGDGQSAATLMGPFADAIVASAVEGLIPPVPRELDTPEATAWMNERRSMQPVSTFTTPITLSTPLEEAPFSRTYIKATADPNEKPESAFWRAAHHAKASPKWNYHEIATNHMIPQMRPRELADILLLLAAAGSA
ncbi:MAG: alpha/beta hydrolase [Actinomycetota bacterium]|jgi:pimeloyl-ACP methyl ester carboxylesterase